MVEALGEDKVITGKPFMGSEDFGTPAESIGVPSVFWFFGGFTEEQMAADDVPVNHSPQFLPVMEPTLSTGYAAAMTAVLSSSPRAPDPSPRRVDSQLRCSPCQRN